jgi:tRNA G18 (ribose-2'-O)-methylase SpoU
MSAGGRGWRDYRRPDIVFWLPNPASTAPGIWKTTEPKCRANRNLKEVLVLGHEYEGLQDDWLAAMDALLEIPMDGEVDSLNVAVTAGIFLHALSWRGSGGK